MHKSNPRIFTKNRIILFFLSVGLLFSFSFSISFFREMLIRFGEYFLVHRQLNHQIWHIRMSTLSIIGIIVCLGSCLIVFRVFFSNFFKQAKQVIFPYIRKIDMKLLMPHELVESYIKKMPRQIKVAFVSTFFIGLICHLYMFTNNIFNHDDHSMMLKGALFISSGHGRWFLLFPKIISGIYTIPFLNSLFAVIYISLSAALIVSMLNIQKKLNVILCAAIIVTAPVLTSDMLYRAYVDVKLFSMLLACLGVYCTNKYKYGLVAGAFLFTLSLAIYQLYYLFAISLFTSLVLLDFTEKIDRDNLKKYMRYFSAILGGFIFYKISLKIFHIQFSSYQNLDKMGVDLKNIPMAFKGIVRYYIQNYYANYSYYFKPVLPTMLVVSSVFCIVLLYLKQKESYKNNILTKLFLLMLITAFVFSTGLIYITSSADNHHLTQYGYLMLPIIAIAIVDRIRVGGGIKLISGYFISISIGFMIVNGVIIASTAYTHQQLAVSHGQNLAVKIATDITNQLGEDYNENYLVKLVGGWRPTKYVPAKAGFFLYISPFYSNPIYFDGNFTGLDGTILMGRGYGQQINSMGILKNSFTTDYFVPLTDIEKQVIEKMPLYPNKGSIKIVDNTILVLFEK